VDSEFELIGRLIARLPPPGLRVPVGPGDDAAVTEPAGAVVTTVDSVVEGVHFTLPEFPLPAVGRKALASALSDIAAMGADPGEAYVAAAVPERLRAQQIEELLGSLGEAASRYRVALAGGDLSRAPVLMLAVTAVGYQGDGPLVRRQGARPGDVIVLTGELGGAAAALRVLGDERRRQALEPGVADALVARQLDPQPRLRAGSVLAATGARAMIDISDGLGADALHVSTAGRVALEIELERVPVQAGVAEVAGGEREAIEVAATGGDDLELLAILPSDQVERAAEAVASGGCALTSIGVVSEGSGVTLRLPDGGELEPRGYDHLRS
jgi:thiamine-monophosphate kinase